MALLETDSVLYGKVKGNLSIIYPATRKENVVDLEDASEFESGLMTPNQVKVVGTLDELSNDAVYMGDPEEPTETTPVAMVEADILGGKYTASDIDELVRRITALENR